jgi:hypothetical protein
MAVRKNSKLRDILTGTILQLQREGHLNRLRAKWWNFEMKKCQKQVTDSPVIALNSIGGLFIIMAFFILITVILMIFDIIKLRKLTEQANKK